MKAMFFHRKLSWKYFFLKCGNVHLAFSTKTDKKFICTDGERVESIILFDTVDAMYEKKNIFSIINGELKIYMFFQLWNCTFS